VKHSRQAVERQAERSMADADKQWRAAVAEACIELQQQQQQQYSGTYNGNEAPPAVQASTLC